MKHIFILRTCFRYLYPPLVVSYVTMMVLQICSCIGFFVRLLVTIISSVMMRLWLLVRRQSSKAAVN